MDLPTQGGNSGTWGTDLNTELQKIIDAVEASVPSNAIDFSADLDVNSQSLFSIDHLRFDEISAPSQVRAVYFDTNGELAIEDGAGNTVTLTSSGALNGASGGGIAGSGYGTSGVEVAWVSGSSEYTFKTGAGANDYAAIVIDGLFLRDGSGNEIKIDAPSIASDYTLTLGAALPGSNNSVMLVDTSGNITYDADPPHGNRVLDLSAVMAHYAEGQAAAPSFTVAAAALTLGTTGECWWAIPLKAGDVIGSIGVRLNTAAATSTDLTLYSSDGDGTSTAEDTLNFTGAASWETQTVTSIAYTVVQGDNLYFEYNGAQSDQVQGIWVTYTRA